MKKTFACVIFASFVLMCGACLKPLDIYTLTVTSDDESRGTVSGGGQYLDGATVTLTATPNEGYVLWKWSDGDTSRSRIVAVSGNANYIAYFKVKTVSNPYAHLKLSDYQTFGNPVSSPIQYDYPLYFGIRDVRQIVVTQLQGGDGNYVNMCLDLRNTTTNTFNYQDVFSFWSPEYGWQNSTEMPLYDNTTIGYTAHTYQSQWGWSSAATVKCTYSNIGWILEFDKPVRITWIQNNVQYNLLRYSTTPL